MAIKILTDSTCDLPKDMIKSYGLTIVPLKVIFGKEEFIDGVDLTPTEFYEKLIDSDELPTTSQLTPDQFIPFFEKAKKDGDDLICILVSSSMSGTFQSGSVAKGIVGYDGVHVIDSRTVTVQLGLMVIEAAKMVKSSAKTKEIVTRVNELVESSVMYAGIATLKYLKKGGRIRATSAMIGSALNIKPIVTINDGMVENIGKARGVKKSFDEIKKLIDGSNTTLTGKDIYIAHAYDKENLVRFKEFLLDNYKPKNVYESEVGSVVGTHAGPGCVVVAFEQ